MSPTNTTQAQSVPARELPGTADFARKRRSTDGPTSGAPAGGRSASLHFSPGGSPSLAGTAKTRAPGTGAPLLSEAAETSTCAGERLTSSERSVTKNSARRSSVPARPTSR